MNSMYSRGMGGGPSGGYNFRGVEEVDYRFNDMPLFRGGEPLHHNFDEFKQEDDEDVLSIDSQGPIHCVDGKDEALHNDKPISISFRNTILDQCNNQYEN